MLYCLIILEIIFFTLGPKVDLVPESYKGVFAVQSGMCNTNFVRIDDTSIQIVVDGVDQERRLFTGSFPTYGIQPDMLHDVTMMHHVNAGNRTQLVWLARPRDTIAGEPDMYLSIYNPTTQTGSSVFDEINLGEPALSFGLFDCPKLIDHLGQPDLGPDLDG